MKWILTAFRFLSNRLTAWRKSITPLAFACVLFSACSLPFSFARADDFEENASVLRIEDLTPEARVSVSNLAIALSASSSGDRASATVEDNVQAILGLLSSLITSNNNIYLMRTYPQAWVGMTLAQFQYWLSSGSTFSGVTPSGADLLFGSRILNQLGAISNILVHPAPADMGWTNRLGSLPLILSQLDGSSRYGFSLSEWIDENRNVSGNLNSLQSYLGSVVHSYSSGPYNSTLLGVYDMALSDVWEAQADGASSSDSALRVVDANVLSALMQLDSTLSSIGSGLSDLTSEVGSGFGSTGSVTNQLSDLLSYVTSIEDYSRAIHEDDLEYYNTDRSVQRDFRFLHQQLGVENPSRTNNIYYLLSRLFDDSSARSVVSATGAVVSAEINSAMRSAESAVSSASNVVARMAEDEEPDWEHDRYTGDNPLDTGDSIFDLPLQQVRTLLPTLPDSQHKEIILFRGDFPIMGGFSAQSPRSGRSVRLDISYPLEHFDDVSSGMVSLRAIMEWVWQLCSAVLCVTMLFRFYTSLATDKLNMEADAAMGV